MTDLKLAKQNSINKQMRPWGGLDEKVNEALSIIPREKFVPTIYQKLTFADFEIPLNDTHKMLAPKVESKLLSALNIKNNETVLEIGSGCGYLTAVLSKLAKQVVGIELDKTLFLQAQKNINQLSIQNIQLINDNVYNFDFNTPYDVILFNVSLPNTAVLKKDFYSHLTINGRLIAPIGTNKDMKVFKITRKSEKNWQEKVLFNLYLKEITYLQEAKAEFVF